MTEVAHVRTGPRGARIARQCSEISAALTNKFERSVPVTGQDSVAHARPHAGPLNGTRPATIPELGAVEGDRFMKRMLMVLCLFATAALAAPADNSCVDLANDGVCDPSDPPLSTLLNDGTFDARSREPGYNPTPALPVGLIFDNFVVPKDVPVSVHATGNVTFMHRLSSKGLDSSFDVRADGTITLAEKAYLRIGGDLTLRAPHLVVGPKAEIMAAQDTSDLVIEAATIVTGEQATFAAPGHEGSLIVRASESLTLGDKTFFQTDQRARLEISTYADLVATNLRIYAGDVKLEVGSSAAHPGPRRIDLTDGVIRQSYPRGKIDVYAGPLPRGAHTAGDGIRFLGGGVKSQTAGREYFDPPALFLRHNPRR